MAFGLSDESRRASRRAQPWQAPVFCLVGQAHNVSRGRSWERSARTAAARMPWHGASRRHGGSQARAERMPGVGARYRSALSAPNATHHKRKARLTLGLSFVKADRGSSQGLEIRRRQEASSECSMVRTRFVPSRSNSAKSIATTGPCQRRRDRPCSNLSSGSGVNAPRNEAGTH